MTQKSDLIKRVVLSAFTTIALILLTSATCISQNTYRDLEGRFSLDLPEGWELSSEKMNLVYVFGSSETSASINLTYMEDITQDDLIITYLETILDLDGGTLPPPGSVVDMTLNGASARWIEYSFEILSEGVTIKLYAYIGAVVDDQKRGVGFFSMLNDISLESHSEAIKNSFGTFQLYDLPLSGIQDVREAEVDYSDVAKASAIAPPSTYEHNFFTVDLPGGWKTENGSGDILVKADKDVSGTCTLSIMGKKKNQFGASDTKILEDVADGLLAGIPSMKKVNGPYELIATSGERVLVEDYEGTVEASGQSFSFGSIVAATKNSERGLGFLGLYSLDIKEEAMKDLHSIISSLR